MTVVRHPPRLVFAASGSWPTFDATAMIGHGSREQILQSYRDVRDGLFRRIKQRFGLEGGPTV